MNFLGSVWAVAAGVKRKTTSAGMKKRCMQTLYAVRGIGGKKGLADTSGFAGYILAATSRKNL
jgi:hypothetical protein